MPLRWYQQEAVDAVLATPRGTNPLVVAPTGAGKSHIIAALVEEYDVDIVLVIAHRKELLVQNRSKLGKGTFFCAGLNEKTISPIVFGSIQTLAAAWERFVGKRIAVIIDEAHLVPTRSETRYQKFLGQVEPLVVVGLTATPYRLDSGSLIGETFHKIAYDIPVAKLMKEGFLSPVVGVQGQKRMDVQSLHIRCGDFIQTEAEAMALELARVQCEEILGWSAERKSGLVFCCGVAHAQAVCEVMRAHGQTAEFLSGNCTKEKRAIVLKQFQSGVIRWLSNCDILTTGFDAPNVDCIALLRPTKSTALYVQMVGRGLRVAEGKKNCLVLDFGENVERHGPIDEVDPKTQTNNDGTKKAKECSECHAFNKLGAETCVECGADFKSSCPDCGFKQPIKVVKKQDRCPECNRRGACQVGGGIEASRASILAKVEVYDVQSTSLAPHTTRAGDEVVQVQMLTDSGVFTKYLNPKWHDCRNWLKAQCAPTEQARSLLGTMMIDDYSQDGILAVAEKCLRGAAKVQVKKKGKFWNVERALFETQNWPSVEVHNGRFY